MCVCVCVCVYICIFFISSRGITYQSNELLLYRHISGEV